MAFSLRVKLKRSYSIIRHSLSAVGVSEWLKDNFYIIDRHYRRLKKHKKSLRHFELYEIIRKYCEARDFEPDASSLIKYLLSTGRDYTFSELNSVNDILASCAIIKISELLSASGRTNGISSAVKMLISINDPEYADIVPAVWRPEKLLIRHEPDYEINDAATKFQYRLKISERADRFDEYETAKELINEAQTKGVPLGKLLFVPRKKYAVAWVLLVSSLFLALLSLSAFAVGWMTLLLLIPFAVTASAIADQIISFFAPAYNAPRLLLDSVPDDAKTLVAVASLMSGNDNSVFESLSRFRYMNPDDNIYFCLLADLPDSSTQYHVNDSEIIESARRRIDELNALHGERFCLFFRERVLNKSEDKYGGWERKRGAVCELVSHIVNGGKTEYYGGDFIRDIKYLLTLDSDTNLSVGSVTDMLSVALHPANKPEAENGRVVSGYGIIQPTVRTELVSAYRTGFSRLISGAGGADSYANASFQRSQSLFGSGNFCGKGLINVSLFYELLNGKIPEGMVLSHDVVEGGVLRTLCASDIVLTDSTPGNTVSFYRRQHRWLRGDFQNLYFLGNCLQGAFSKLRLSLTVLKHLSPLMSFSAIVWGCFLNNNSGIWVFLLAYSEFLIPCAFSVARFLLSRSPFACMRFFSKAYTMLTQMLIRVLFELCATARKAMLVLNAFSLSAVRMVTRKKTLEWTTAAQAEKLSSTLGKYVLDGVSSVIIGFTMLGFASTPFMRFAGLLYFVYPLVAAVLSRRIDGGHEARPTLTEKQKRMLLVHAKDMFGFYYDNVNEETNHLPPDNIQLSPVYARAMRTSPTNIGFYLVSLVAALDMGLLDKDEFYNRISNTLSSVEGLEKYNGNLYNWYDLNDMSILGERYVSAVDSGNFIVMLVALKEALREYEELDSRLKGVAVRVELLIESTDLTVFYDKKRELFRIGLRATDNKLDNSCYDMLMSEARLLAYYSVASSTVSKKHWQSLGRTLTHKSGYIGMKSWSGTAFEYLMPQLFLPLYRDSFVFESIAFSIMIQRAKGTPWGISESGFYSFDSDMNYQYKANGIQTLALRRISDNENIVSPYSTYLSFCICGNSAVKNLRTLENRGMYGKYGLYEALDMNNGSGGVCVKSYMAHHIGMSIIACMNASRDNIFVKRFMADKQMNSASELLCEKIPTDAHVFEDNCDVQVNQKRVSRANNDRTEQISLEMPKVMLLTRGDLTATVSDNGHIGLNCGDRMIAYTEYKRYSMRFSPCVIFTRGGRNYGCARLYGNSNCSFERGNGFAAHIASGKEFSGRVRYSMSKSCNCFVINTRAEAMKKYDITLAFEPVLEQKKKFLSHISFSRLFIESEYDRNKRILYFHRRSSRDGSHIYSLAIAPRDKDMEFSFRTDRENFAASSIVSPFDYASCETDNSVGACIDPLCLVRCNNAEGGRATFLITCGETKNECEKNIRLARSDKGECETEAKGEIFDKMLSYLLYGRENKGLFEFDSASVGDLWSRRISSDYPLAVVYASEKSASRTRSVIDAFLTLQRACKRCELIFIINDSDGYNRPIEASVRECCAELKCLQYIGRSGGIFILREGEIGESLAKAIKNSASFYMDYSNGIEEPCGRDEISLMPTIATVQNASRLILPENAFSSKNGYFINDSFVVDKSSLPGAPYSYILTGHRFSTVVTQSSLGYTFFDNARERRLCSFYGDPKTLDDGERIFLLHGNKKYDLCACSYKVSYEKGIAVYHGNIEDNEYRATVTVHPKFPVKLVRIEYDNRFMPETVFSLEPVMGDTVFGSNRIETVGFSQNGNEGIMFKNIFGMTYPEGYGFAGVASGRADVGKIRLFASGNDVLFFLGACASESGALNVASRINKHFFESCVSEARGFAESLVPNIRVNTRSNTNNILMNYFLPYQVAACRFFARGSFYQSGGAYGFRDQLQDSLTLVFSMPHKVRVHIIRCCAHQYVDGSVMHWWHTRNFDSVNRGIKSKCSDDLLYLPIVVADYLQKTGDESLLDTETYYMTSAPLGEMGERYEQPQRSDIKESVYKHCLRALACAEKLGRNGLVLMGSCDWNDAFSLVGEKGLGESVFSTLLFIIAAERFVPIMESRGDAEAAEHYRAITEKLRRTVDEIAFYGDRYARAICDDGTVLGVESSEECKIDILSQAFAELAKINPERSKTALVTAFSKLYDRKHRIFKLFSPPFANGRARVGYIRGYVAGIRENGGQYTHGALWGALGCLSAGLTEEALLILDCANPASRCADKELASRYKCEPYAIAADIYSGDHVGRGGWSWYTGAASWYYRIMVETVLGLKLGAGNSLLSAEPKIAFDAEIVLGKASLYVSASENLQLPTLDGKPVSFPLTVPDGEHKLELPLG